LFKSDSGIPVVFSFLPPESGWTNPDDATDEVYIGYNGGNLYTAQDYNISMSGETFLLFPNTEKTIYLDFSATRKEADGANTPLYYKESDRKFYTSYDEGSYTGLAAGDNKVTWKQVRLYTDNYKVADMDITVTSGTTDIPGKLSITIPELDFEGFYTLKATAEYLGISYDYDLVFTCSRGVQAAASKISELTKSDTIAIEGEITGSDFFALNDALRHSNLPASVRVTLDLSQTNITELYDTVHNATEPQSFINCSNLSCVILPSTLKKIGNSSFRWSGITSIDIPSSVTTIGTCAFFQANGLTSITIPSSVTRINESAFQLCANLHTAVLNCNTTIPNYCFYSCTNLTTIEISTNVRGFSKQCFYGCTSLTTINYAGTIEQWNALPKGEEVFTDVPATVVHCSDGDVDL